MRTKLRLESIFLIALLLAAVAGLGQGFSPFDPAYKAEAATAAAGGGGGNPPASPLINQNFEGTGFDNGETWQKLGTASANEDYTTTVLMGSQSLYVAVDPFSFSEGAYSSFTAGGERWGYTMFRVAVSSDTLQLIDFEDSGFSKILRCSISSTSLKVECPGGGASATTVATFSTGTTYRLWWHYLKGSGANATAEIWFSSTGTKPADGSNNHAKTTAGTATTDATYVNLGGNNVGGATSQVIYDHCYVDDVAILSDP